MNLFPIHIPAVDNWNNFLYQMKVVENKLINDLVTFIKK